MKSLGINRVCLNFLATGLLLTLMVSCHPEGCYGPKAFGYNTKGVSVSNLFGIYRFDGINASVLDSNGFSNHSGYIELRPDMTCALSNVPRIWRPEAGLYASGIGKWKPVKNGTIWELDIVAASPESQFGSYNLNFTILNEAPPHGIEIAIRHDLGYYIRYKKDESVATNGVAIPR